MDIVKVDDVIIENLIYEVRGKQVMIDSDLAKLYECKNGTKEINQAVKNNPRKFPARFCFRISENDYNFLKSKQIHEIIPKWIFLIHVNKMKDV